MDPDTYWFAVRSMRLAVAELLDTLTPRQWEAPSLCDGWRVRDVAGHLSLVPLLRARQMLAVAPRAGFNPHRINTLLAIRTGSRATDEITRAIREHAGDHRVARGLDTRDVLFDVVVHSQDIATPLGLELEVPPDWSGEGLQRVWEMGWPFRARRRLAGLSLHADDTDWSAGSGREVHGPALALLLLLTGRTTSALPRLDGPGTDVLVER